MTPQQARAAHLTRRQFFSKSAVGIGGAALASLMEQDMQAATSGLPAGIHGLEGLPHFAPKAKRVIYLLQNGAPPHLDTFDWKPEMEKFRGQEIPASVLGGRRFSRDHGFQAIRQMRRVGGGLPTAYGGNRG